MGRPLWCPARGRVRAHWDLKNCFTSYFFPPSLAMRPGAKGLMEQCPVSSCLAALALGLHDRIGGLMKSGKWLQLCLNSRPRYCPGRSRTQAAGHWFRCQGRSTGGLPLSVSAKDDPLGVGKAVLEDKVTWAFAHHVCGTKGPPGFRRAFLQNRVPWVVQVVLENKGAWVFAGRFGCL